MEPNLGHISKNQVRFIRSLQQKKVRDEEKLFVAEGDKCISELLGHFDLVYLVESVECSVESSLKVESYQVNKWMATPTELSQMSSLKTPQGSLAVFRQKPDKLSTTELDGFSIRLADRAHQGRELATFNLISQGAIVADSLRDYLSRHSEIECELSRGGQCEYLTTDIADKFETSASLFLSEPIHATQIELV